MADRYLSDYIQQIRSGFELPEKEKPLEPIKKRIMDFISDDDVKPLFARLTENPEDHEELMMELIENKEIKDHEPYDVFRSVVYLATEYLQAMTGQSIRAADIASARISTIKAEALAVKIDDYDKAEKLWLDLDQMAEEAGIADDDIKQSVMIKIAEIREKREEFSEAAGILDYMLTNCRDTFSLPLESFVMMRHAEILHKSGQTDRAISILQSVINKNEKEEGSPVLCARAWLTLSRIINAGSDIREAIRHYINTLEEAARAEETDVLIAASDELGKVFVQNDQPQESWDVLNQAYNTAMGINDYAAMVHLLQTMWYSCQELKKWGDFIVLLRSAHHFVTGNEIAPLTGKVNELFARVQIEMGNNAEAQRYLDQATESYQAVNDEEGLMNIDELAARVTAD